MKQVYKLLARTFALLLCASWATHCWAELTLNGIATHTNYGQDQFIAAIYCESPTSDARTLLLDEGQKALELRVVVEQLHARRFKRMWVESIAINAGSLELENQAENMAKFANMLKVKLRVGDIFRVERDPESGVKVLLDGHELGTISDPRFFDLLLRTWVGPVPLSTQFKKDLLAAGEVNDDQRRIFYATKPSPSRVLAITNALNRATAAAVSSPPSATTDEEPAPPPSSEDEPSVETAAVPAATAAMEAAATSSPAAIPENAIPGEIAGPPPSPSTEEETATTEEEALANTTGLVGEESLFEDDDILGDDSESVTAESLLNEQLYISKLTRWTGSFVEYPRKALRSNYEGTVRLMVTIDRQGEVQSIEYEEETPHKSLNQSAYKAVEKASPYPAVPNTIKSDTFSFSIPIAFRLQ